MSKPSISFCEDILARKDFDITELKIMTQAYLDEVVNHLWRPIKTAPRDGTFVIIGWFELPGQDSQAIAAWDKTKKAWTNTWMAFSSDPDQQPTHWMPRSAPPTLET